jgi:dipeptidase D
MENRKPVVLQAHLDMVPQKNNDTVHDFTKDPIQPYIDGDWVKARGTTLGADNGIGMASALAVLADDSVEHGPLEVLLTMTEEAGMDGAFGLQANWLQADILINTDSEEEGEIYMGCAGGIDFISTLPLSREAIPAGFQTFKLTLKGLKGGHSGGDIHLVWVTPTSCWRASWQAMRPSWICVWSISTAVPCVTRSRVKPSPPSPFPRQKRTS